MQYSDELKGALFIKDPNDPWKSFYHNEEILQITDWYHIHLKTYLYPGTSDPIPDTVLINDIGQYNCTSNGKYNIELNLKNPIYRDTLTINSYSYVIVRFKADNPSIWMLHYHKDWHLQLGVASVIIESPEFCQRFLFEK
ncbi:hypothetical protein I4U23_000194 [Adineta vaga]|nr:hypothetical protein I4U23_000194 [Adineta vaga]